MSSVTVEFSPTAIFAVSEKEVAVIDPVKVIAPSPIATAPNTAFSTSTLIVLANLTLEKSSAVPADGIIPFFQFAAVEKLPSMPPTQTPAGSCERSPMFRESALLPASQASLAPLTAVASSANLVTTFSDIADEGVRIGYSPAARGSPVTTSAVVPSPLTEIAPPAVVIAPTALPEEASFSVVPESNVRKPGSATVPACVTSSVVPS